MTQPASVVFDGNDRVLWVPAIADIEFPALSELTAGGVFDATCYLTGDGWNPSMTEETVDDRRLCSRVRFQKCGTEGWELPMIYTINPESPDDDEARETFVKGATGYFVERPARDHEEDIDAWDYVAVWAVELGKPQLSGRSQNGVWVFSQMAYLRPPGVPDAPLVAVIAS